MPDLRTTLPDGAPDTAELVRVGWLAKGFLFVTIGLLAAEIARGAGGGGDADQRGALEIIVEQPAGRALVAVVGMGLVLFAVWQVMAALSSTDWDLQTAAMGVGRFGLGLAYGILALSALEMAVTGPSGTSKGSTAGEVPTSPDSLTARLLDFPLGAVLVAAIGAGCIAVGAYLAWQGIGFRFLDEVDVSDLGTWPRHVLRVLGVVGYWARALVSGVIGYMFSRAALDRNPDEAAGMDQALQALRSAPLGPVVLIACALGLACAGLYDMVTFRRRGTD